MKKKIADPGEYILHIEFGSDIDTQANKSVIKKTGENQFWEEACLFRSGRDALRMLAKKLYPAHTRVFIPALSCASMTAPFLQNGIKVVYYPLTEDFTINYDFLDAHLQDGDIILYMDYFGISTEKTRQERRTYFAGKKKEKQGLLTLDDRTHSLRRAMGARFSADYMLFSVRKWASLPDGGLLIPQKPIPFAYDAYDRGYYEMKKQAMDLKSAYLKDARPETKERFVRLLEEAEQALSKKNRMIEMSEPSARLLKTIDFTEVEAQRKQNAEVLFRILHGHSLLPEVREGPLFFPVMAKNQKAAQQYLARSNIYCPVIWPLQDEARGVCGVCEDIAGHMLAIPCDQRYSLQETEYIGGKVLAAVRL